MIPRKTGQETTLLESVPHGGIFMDNNYKGMAVGVFELDNLVACFVALDAASKAANVRIQSVERNRLKSGACVKMRGSVSDVNAAMEVALEAAKPLGKVVSHTVIASPSEDTEIALKMTINKYRGRRIYELWCFWFS